MRTFFVSFIVALLSSLILTRVARWTGLKYGITDKGGARKKHRGEIPRLGGPAVAIAFFIPLAALLVWENKLSALLWRLSPSLLALFVGGVLTLCVGLWDDLGNVRARYKLLAQTIIGIVVYYFGVQIQAVTLPWVGKLSMGVFALPVTVLWIVGFMNMLNLVDGIDGLCSGVVLVAALTEFVVAWTGDALVVALFSASLAGTALGFLRYNFNPASIFLGDSGSYFFGFVLAMTSIVGSQKASMAVATIAPLLALGLPLTDTLMAIVRRTVRGRPVFSADKEHLHHRLLNRGYSERTVVSLLFAGTAVLGAAAFVIVTHQSWPAALALVTSFVVIVVLVRTSRPIRNANQPEQGNPMPEAAKSRVTRMTEALVAVLDEQSHTSPCTVPAKRVILQTMARVGEAADFSEIRIVGQEENGPLEKKSLRWTQPGQQAEAHRRERLVRCDCSMGVTGTNMPWRAIFYWYDEDPWIPPRLEALCTLCARFFGRLLERTPM